MEVIENAILVSMDVTGLYTIIPQEQGDTTICNTYEHFHNNKHSIPTHFLRDLLRLVQGSFQFNQNTENRYGY